MSAGLPPPPAPNTPGWEAWRRCGIGASEIPALLGEDPWTTERALALEKRGLVERRRATSAMDWGHRVEALGAEMYEEREGCQLVETGTLIDPTHPHVFATPDRHVTGEARLVELKWTNKWSDPPRRVVIQCQVQMRVAGAEVVDVVVMGPYGEPKVHAIRHDEAGSLALVGWAEEWYVRYVLGDELPPIDGSDQTRRHLASLGGSGTLTATDDQERLMASLREAGQDKAAAEQDEARIGNLLADSMVGHDRLEGQGWHISWKEAKGRRTTDWKAVASGLSKGRHRLLARLTETETKTGEPSRPFRPKWKEEG